MSLRESAQDAVERARELRERNKTRRKKRRQTRKEKRQVKRAVRRDKIWGAADAWWTLRNDIANDPVAKKRVRRLAWSLNPVAGAIATAALEVDRVVAPTVLDFIEEKQAVSRAILQEMVDAGRLTEAEAGILADEVDDILAGAPATAPVAIPGGYSSTSTADDKPPVNYLPWLAAIGALFLIRGSR